VVGYYRRTGRLVSVNGDQPVDDVTTQIYRIIEDHHA
jgi:adenylate kinase family enzyme